MSAVGQCQYDLLCELGAHDPITEPCRHGKPVVVVPVPVPAEPTAAPVASSVQPPAVLDAPVPTLPLGPTDRL